MSVRVLVVDDHPMMRAGLTALFDTDPSIEVVAAVGTTAEALALVSRERPDVVLMDLQFNRAFEGAKATRDIRALPDPPAVLILTNVLKVRRRGDAATQRDARSPPAAALPLNVDHQPLTTTHHGDRRSTSGNTFRPCASVSP